MAILCLLLGLLSVVGSGSSQDPSTSVTPTVTTNQPTTVAPSNQPATVAPSNQPTTVAPSNQPATVAPSKQPATVAPSIQSTNVSPSNQPATVAAATVIVTSAASAATTSVATTPANTSPNILATISAITRAPQSGTLATPSNRAPIGPSATITSAQATSPPVNPSRVTKQATTPVTVKPTSQSIASTADNSVTSTLGSSKHPKGTGATEAPQVNATEADPNSTSSATAIGKPPQDTETPKSTDRSPPALPSSASPHPRMASSTIAGGIIDTTTPMSVIPHLLSGHSSVPATSPELTTHKDIGSQTTTEADKSKKLKEKNIEVECTNTTNEKSKTYVTLTIVGSAICDNNGERTEGGRVTEDFNTMIMHVCKAIKPGYQENQDKCIVRLANINGKDLAITEAFIESHLLPKELHTQMKRNGANPNLFRFDGAEPEDEDVVSIPLISAIVSLAVLLLIIAAAYGCWHQRKARKREQRLTEELQTMENGYHDNPTLEVMETSPEMQEKKGGPNGELGDSWIVPLDNLTREDLEEEEDTHL